MQVAAKVEQAAQQQTQAVADLVQRQAGGGGGGQLASGGGTDRNGAPFQVRAAVAAQRTLSRAGLGWAVQTRRTTACRAHTLRHLCGEQLVHLV